MWTCGQVWKSQTFCAKQPEEMFLEMYIIPSRQALLWHWFWSKKKSAYNLILWHHTNRCEPFFCMCTLYGGWSWARSAWAHCLVIAAGMMLGECLTSPISLRCFDDCASLHIQYPLRRLHSRRIECAGDAELGCVAGVLEMLWQPRKWMRAKLPKLLLVLLHSKRYFREYLL